MKKRNPRDGGIQPPSKQRLINNTRKHAESPNTLILRLLTIHDVLCSFTIDWYRYLFYVIALNCVEWVRGSLYFRKQGNFYTRKEMKEEEKKLLR